MSSLDVYLHDERAGTLDRLDSAKLRFAYDPDWLTSAAAPLSLALPLREEPYADSAPILDSTEETIEQFAEVLIAAATEPA